MLGLVGFRQGVPASPGTAGYFLANGDRRAVVAVDVHGEVYAVSRWAGLKSREIVERLVDSATLPSVSETQELLARKVGEVLKGFITHIKADFQAAAQAMEAKRLAMVQRQRAARAELQLAHDERWTREAVVRAERFRRGILSLWDCVTGKHAKLRKYNEKEVAAATKRDVTEKQDLVEMQLGERQRLQREIVNTRRIHVREVTRLYQEIAATGQLKHTKEGRLDLEVERSRRHMTPQLEM